MQLTRTVLTIALAANTASALPLCTSGDCANALEPSGDGLDAASVPHEKRSHTSAHPHVDIGSHSSDAKDAFSSNQRTEKEAMDNHQSPGTPQIKTLGHGQGVNALPTGSGEQSEQMIHVSETHDDESQFGNQDSARSSGYNGMPSIQQNAMENKHDNTENGANHSKNKMGFAVRVRELFKVFGQAQGHMRTEQQHQQEQNLENSVDMRQDRAQGHASSDRMHINDKEQQAETYQAQGSRQDSVTQAEGARERMDHSNYNQKQEQENARPDAQHHSAMSQNRKHARSHTDRSGAHSHEMEQMNNQESQHREQHQEQQGLKQKDMNCHEEEGSQQQQMQQMQQMQPQSEMTRIECLRAAMDDVHK
ncbi:hypothetical protein C8A01DRAFT_14433 [Parachaetomium inaequale]|uniref:Uncharacterized protein n=1 Tax=Parachaetomium inaequale TaxID=2588326 RepID=A0AAN6PJ67_9PEZI|nr:hypothetical protein C8A01DRAFT_14433 [Parachaetomium inaequale]